MAFVSATFTFYQIIALKPFFIYVSFVENTIHNRPIRKFFTDSTDFSRCVGLAFKSKTWLIGMIIQICCSASFDSVTFNTINDVHDHTHHNKFHLQHVPLKRLFDEIGCILWVYSYMKEIITLIEEVVIKCEAGWRKCELVIETFF